MDCSSSISVSAPEIFFLSAPLIKRYPHVFSLTSILNEICFFVKLASIPSTLVSISEDASSDEHREYAITKRLFIFSIRADVPQFTNVNMRHNANAGEIRNLSLLVFNFFQLNYKLISY